MSEQDQTETKSGGISGTVGAVAGAGLAGGWMLGKQKNGLVHDALAGTEKVFDKPKAADVKRAIETTAETVAEGKTRSFAERFTNAKVALSATEEQTKAGVEAATSGLTEAEKAASKAAKMSRAEVVKGAKAEIADVVKGVRTALPKEAKLASAFGTSQYGKVALATVGGAVLVGAVSKKVFGGHAAKVEADRAATPDQATATARA